MNVVVSLLLFVSALSFSARVDARTKGERVASNTTSVTTRSEARVSESLSLASPENRSSFTIEAFGRGLLYSLSYDHLVSRNVALGIYATSAGFFGLGGYSNYYLLTDIHRPFLTVGAGYIFTPRDKQQGSQMRMDGAVFTPGAGYEFRTDMGILLRLTAYGLVEKSRGFVPWGGASFGWTF